MESSNIKVINCNKHDNPVIRKKLKEVTVEEGMEIATKLFQVLNKRKDGIGLAANQVGIDAQVAVVNVREPLVLINPKISDKSDEISYFEGCLSFPGKGVRTKRYETVEVKTAQQGGSMIFSGKTTGIEGVKGTWESDENKNDTAIRLLEAVCVQHEIDHLNGVVCMDRRIDTTYRAEKKIGRNQLVTLKKGDAVKVVKYKKAASLISGGWELQGATNG